MGFGLLVELDGASALQALERRFDHGDGTIDNLVPGGDGSDGFLSLEHSVGDLPGVGQVRDARIGYTDASSMETVVEQVDEVVVDLFLGAAKSQRCVVVTLVRVVGVGACQLTDCALAHHSHVLLVVRDVERAAVSVLDRVDESTRDIDGVTQLVIDL